MRLQLLFTSLRPPLDVLPLVWHEVDANKAGVFPPARTAFKAQLVGDPLTSGSEEGTHLSLHGLTLFGSHI